MIVQPLPSPYRNKHEHGITDMTDQELANELSVTACAVSVELAIDALKECAHSMGKLKWSALGLGNDQAFEFYENREEAYTAAARSLSQSLTK